MEKKEYSVEVGGKTLTAEISNLADQANGSVLVRYGKTTVFATAVMSKHIREGMDYLPLRVDYEEKFYAAGSILGSRFMRREGRPSDEGTLTTRMIDRTIRPLFNQKIRNELQVIVLALSFDGENDTDIPAIIAASLALGISDIPWGGPVGAARISHVDGEYAVNANYEEREKADLNMVACGREGKINMIETGAEQVSENVASEAMKKAVEEIGKTQKFQEDIIKEIGKEKADVKIKEEPAGMRESFDKSLAADLKKAMYEGAKGDISEVKSKWSEIVKEEFGDEHLAPADDLFEEKTDELLHKEALENGRRPDGRKFDEVRPLLAEVGALPIVHGSGIFFRGGTHVLSVVTLGGPKDSQLIEGMEVRTKKRFMHHYNFPPFSTGETGRMGGAGRREIGHGALAEKALLAVIPDVEDFPYTIRVVSESMASNGSTSQGSICASTLAMMDAGIPIKNPVAGIAIGLVMESDENYKILTDIQGPEDHYGDMDFKVAGTKDGITAIQMDVKVGGVTVEMLEKAMEHGKNAREEILKTILKTIPEPRKELLDTAPRIVKVVISPDKIGTVVGPGGKMINSIIDKTGVQIDIDQDGTVLILGKDKVAMEEAKKIVESLVHEYEIGEMMEGPVSRLFDFGAMVQVGPTQEGLVHISELAPFRVNKVTDVVNIGDMVKVKVVGIDDKGRVNLSIKQADPNYKLTDEDKRKAENGGRERSRPRGNFRGRR